MIGLASPVGSLVDWLASWLVGSLVVWFVGRWLLNWFADGSIPWIVVRLAGCSVAWLVCCCLVVGWLSCLVRLAGWLVGWLVWLNPPTPGPKPRGLHREGSGRGPSPT